jgi:PadR family transcriptional regulator PadR
MKGKHLGEFEEIVLLAVRQLDQDATVLKIRELLSRAVKRDASLGAIYSALDRLERKKLSVSQVGDASLESKGRARRLYTLTEAGEAALAETRQVRNALWLGTEEVA